MRQTTTLKTIFSSSFGDSRKSLRSRWIQKVQKLRKSAEQKVIIKVLALVTLIFFSLPFQKCHGLQLFSTPYSFWLLLGLLELRNKLCQLTLFLPWSTKIMPTIWQNLTKSGKKTRQKNWRQRQKDGADRRMMLSIVDTIFHNC